MNRHEIRHGDGENAISSVSKTLQPVKKRAGSDSALSIRCRKQHPLMIAAETHAPAAVFASLRHTAMQSVSTAEGNSRWAPVSWYGVTDQDVCVDLVLASLSAHRLQVTRWRVFVPPRLRAARLITTVATTGVRLQQYPTFLPLGGRQPL